MDFTWKVDKHCLLFPLYCWTTWRVIFLLLIFEQDTLFLNMVISFFLSSCPSTGARWDTQAGVITEARLKDLTPAMPVISVRAVPNDRQETRNIYECPLYKTKIRGPTYVWTFSLKTRERPAKWVLAGVALLLSV